MHLQNEIQILIKPSVLKNIGLLFIKKIRDRSASGIDEHGQPFKPYSTKTFALPAGAITKRAQKILVKDGNLSYFHTKSGKLWAVIIGGYVVLKKAVYAQTNYSGRVNLMATGAMMRSLRVQTAANNSINIGFDNDESANKAYYNKLMGREFLGLTYSDYYDPEVIKLLAGGLLLK